jgi:sphingosine kinase
MLDALHQNRRMKDKREVAPQSSLNPDLDTGEVETSLPPLKYSSTDDDGWTTVDKPLLYVFAGKGPYVGR